MVEVVGEVRAAVEGTAWADEEVREEVGRVTEVVETVEAVAREVLEVASVLVPMEVAAMVRVPKGWAMAGWVANSKSDSLDNGTNCSEKTQSMRCTMPRIWSWQRRLQRHVRGRKASLGHPHPTLSAGSIESALPTRA